MKKLNFCLFLTFLVNVMGSCIQAASSSSSYVGHPFEVLAGINGNISDAYSRELNSRIAQTPLNSTMSGLTSPQIQELNQRLNAVVHDGNRLRTEEDRNAAQARIWMAYIEKPIAQNIARYVLTDRMLQIKNYSFAFLQSLFNCQGLRDCLNREMPIAQNAYNTYAALSANAQQVNPRKRFIIRATIINGGSFRRAIQYPLNPPTRLEDYTVMLHNNTLSDIHLHPSFGQFALITYSDNTDQIAFNKPDQAKIFQLTDDQADLIIKLYANRGYSQELTEKELKILFSCDISTRANLCNNYSLFYRGLTITHLQAMHDIQEALAAREQDRLKQQEYLKLPWYKRLDLALVAESAFVGSLFVAAVSIPLFLLYKFNKWR